MKMEADLKTVRRFENKTQEWVAEQIGVSATTVYSQETNLDKTNFGRVKEIFDLLGYDVFVEKRKEEN